MSTFLLNHMSCLVARRLVGLNRWDYLDINTNSQSSFKQSNIIHRKKYIKITTPDSLQRRSSHSTSHKLGGYTHVESWSTPKHIKHPNWQYNFNVKQGYTSLLIKKYTQSHKLPLLIWHTLQMKIKRSINTTIKNHTSYHVNARERIWQDMGAAARAIRHHRREFYDNI